MDTDKDREVVTQAAGAQSTGDQPTDAQPGRRLANPRHEAFARIRARGATQVNSYEAAGYRRNTSLASLLAHRPEVEARIAWLAQRETTLAAATPESTLVALLGIVDAGRRAAGAACAQETRLALRAVLDLHGRSTCAAAPAHPEDRAGGAGCARRPRRPRAGLRAPRYRDLEGDVRPRRLVLGRTRSNIDFFYVDQ